jgi:aryl-alcohol dehydrogenase-like predicted oxidoreductase
MTLATASFGRTGHLSSRAIFGAAALGSMRQERADEILPVLLEFGVNHIDTAASYGDSEVRLHSWMATHRSSFFLASKTGERSGPAARAELELSLTRMGVEQIDLIQLHNLVEPEEWEVAHAPGGVVEAMSQARDEGLVRFIGVTGHGVRIPSMHLRSLERFPYDSVLFPFNHVMMDMPEYAADVAALLERCVADGVAVQTIKAVARRRWDGDRSGKRSWYEPLEDPEIITRAVHYVLAHDGLFLNTSSDAKLLRTILTAASDVQPVPSDQLAADRLAQGMLPLFDGAALERID